MTPLIVGSTPMEGRANEDEGWEDSSKTENGLSKKTGSANGTYGGEEEVQLMKLQSWI